MTAKFYHTHAMINWQSHLPVMMFILQKASSYIIFLTLIRSLIYREYYPNFPVDVIEMQVHMSKM